MKLLTRILDLDSDDETEEVLDKHDQERSQRLYAVKTKWSAWLIKNELAIKYDNIARKLNKVLTDSPITITSTLKAISHHISWSSSKFNEYKKSEVVKSIQAQVTSHNESFICYPAFTSGSFSAGSKGCGNAMAKGVGGTYYVIMYKHCPYFIANEEVILFSGVDYPLLTLDDELFSMHQSYLKELNEIT